MANLIKFLGEVRDGERGQGLAEYALILALIAIVAIIALIFLGTRSARSSARWRLRLTASAPDRN
jgi:Flp pilus assembly pilin Flp